MAKLVIILVASVSTYTLSRSSVLPNRPQRSCAALKATGAQARGDGRDTCWRGQREAVRCRHAPKSWTRWPH